MKASVQYFSARRAYGLSFTEPYFMGQRIAAGFDLFSKTTDDSDYQYYKAIRPRAARRSRGLPDYRNLHRWRELHTVFGEGHDSFPI